MLKGTVKPMCSSGRSGSLVGEGSSAGEGRHRRHRRDHVVERRGRPSTAATRVAWNWLKARNTASPLDAGGAVGPVRGCRAAPCSRCSARQRLHVDVRAHAPEVVHAVEHGLRHEGLHRRDDGAGALEQARGVLHRGAHLGLHRAGRSRLPAAGRCAGRAAARRPRRTSCQAMSCARQAHAVARVGPRQHLHQQRGVGDGARHRPGGAAHVGRVDRDAAQAGLEREDAAPAGRQPQRAADVGADVQRAVAAPPPPRRRRRWSRPASCAGPTGCAPACGSSTGPRTACRSRAWWSWPATTPPASRTRAAGGASAARGRQLDGGGAQRRRVAARGDVFLDGDRHAVERPQRLAAQPARLAGARLLQRALRAAAGRAPAGACSQRSMWPSTDCARPPPARTRAGGSAAISSAADSSCSACRAARHARRSGPGQRRQVVDEDRHVLPQALARPCWRP